MPAPRPTLIDRSPFYPRQPTAFGTTKANEEEREKPERVIHHRLKAPDWVQDRLRAKASPGDILAMLQDRVIRGESDLHEALGILNDFGRRPDGGAALKRFVTQEIITRFGKR